MAYSVSPDAPPSWLDPEAGTSTTPASRSAGYRPAAMYDDRAVERDSAREVDRMVEDVEFTRARKDLERAVPQRPSRRSSNVSAGSCRFRIRFAGP